MKEYQLPTLVSVLPVTLAGVCLATVPLSLLALYLQPGSTARPAAARPQSTGTRDQGWTKQRNTYFVTLASTMLQYVHLLQ